ncbi:hypothetical protein KR084_012901 [Drosophila pseudotakahashii]|nr:hypothetical protein KR084_012901 [Drosophila pseudotakahashii]
MLLLKFFLLSSLLFILVLQGSWTSAQLIGYPQSVCQLNNTQEQCGQYCLSTIQPILNYIPELKDKVNGMYDEMVNIQIKMDAQLLNVQSQLELKQTILQDSLDTIVTKRDFEQRWLEDRGETMSGTEIMSQFQNVLSKIEGLQGETDKPKTIPPHFELIDRRYFFIEHNIKLTWTEAAVSCHRKGGYLAAFKNEEEYRAILPKLTKNQKYWLGINDEVKETNFVSLASGKNALFLNWATGHPKGNSNSDFIFILNDYLYVSDPTKKVNFICQADNEI